MTTCSCNRQPRSHPVVECATLSTSGCASQEQGSCRGCMVGGNLSPDNGGLTWTHCSFFQKD